MSIQDQNVQEDLGAEFARYSVTTTFEDLPEDAVRAAKQSTLDTLGVMLGATGLQEAIEDEPRLVVTPQR